MTIFSDIFEFHLLIWITIKFWKDITNNQEGNEYKQD